MNQQEATLSKITKADVLAAKRAIVVMSEIAKAVPDLAPNKPAEALKMKQDMQALIRIVRAAEASAT